MEFLYKIDEIVVLDPLTPSLNVLLEGVQIDFATRIKEYISNRINGGYGFNHPGEEYRTYIKLCWRFIV